MTPTAAQTVRELCNAARRAMLPYPETEYVPRTQALKVAIAAAEALLAREEKETDERVETAANQLYRPQSRELFRLIHQEVLSRRRCSVFWPNNEDGEQRAIIQTNEPTLTIEFQDSP